MIPLDYEDPTRHRLLKEALYNALAFGAGLAITFYLHR